MRILNHLHRAARMVAAPLGANPTFACFALLLGLVSLLIEVCVLNWKFPKFNLFSLLLDVYLMCLLLCVLPKGRLRRGATLLLCGLLYVLAAVDAFCVYNFKAVIGPEILNVCLETTGRESTEFMSKYLHAGLLLSPVALVLLTALLHAVAARRHWPQPPQGKDGGRTAKAMTLLVALAVAASVVVALPSRINMVRLLLVDSVAALDARISNQTLNTPLNNLLFSVKTRHLATVGLRDLTAFQETVTVDSCAFKSPTIVLIIGESYIKRHSQLYGYHLPTTPRQLRLAEAGELTVFSDVVTPSNLTSTVFKHAFSLHSIDDKDDWSGHALFPVLFRKAGYSVTFLTNQFVKTVTQDAFNITGGLFLNDTRLSQLQFTRRNTQSHQYDMDLTGDYLSMPDEGGPQLIIFHLAGQHIDFGKRCPDPLRLFTAKDYVQRKDLSDAERQTVADYDNATRYNDLVVDSILSLFRSTEAVAIYMPDHGEECYDELHRMGRLPQQHFDDPRAVRAEYEIPFWIWTSPGYRERHPDVAEEILSARERPFMTDDLPHLLLGLAGISCPYYRESRDLLSPHFDTTRHRLLGGQYDYDQRENYP